MQNTTTNAVIENSNHHKNAFLYGILGFPIALLGIPLYLYLPNYYAENFSVSLSLVGATLLAARLGDVVTDPLIGWFSDHHRTQKVVKYQRPIQIFFGSLLLLFGSYQLFFPPADLKWQYLLIWSFITYFGWTLVQVPYHAFNAEISLCKHNKTLLSSYREAFAVIGVITVVTLPVLSGLTATATEFYFLLFLVISISTLIGSLLLFLVRQDQNYREQQKQQHVITTKRSLGPTIRLLWKEHRQVFSIMPSYFLNNLANAIPATLFIIFVSDYLQLEEKTGLFLLSYFFAGILALPLWLALAKKFSKTSVWQLSMLFSGISFIGVFLLEPGDLEGFLLICLLTGFSLAIDIAMPTSIQSDLSQQPLADNTPATGLLFGIWGMLTKLALAVAIGISFPIIDWARAADFMPQTMLLLLYAGLPIILKLSAWVLLKRFSKQYSV